MFTSSYFTKLSTGSAGEDSGTQSAAASTQTEDDSQAASRGGQTGSQTAADGEQQAVAGASQTQQRQDTQESGGRPSQGSTMTAEQQAAMQQAANEMRAASERMARASGQLAVLAYPGNANVVVVQGAPGGLPDLPSGQDSAQQGDDAGGDGRVGTVLVIPGGGDSDDERLATLDGELDASLQVFDGVLLSGRQPTLGGGTGSVSGDGDSGVVYGQTGTGNAGGQEGSGIQVASLPSGNMQGSSAVEGNMQNGQAAGREAAGGPQPVNSGARPSPAAAEVIDGSDDDIVARQLREAAETETDPVLQEKLWREYIAYKKATSQ